MLLLWILVLCIAAGAMFAALGTVICLRTKASDGTVTLRLFDRFSLTACGTAVSLFVIAAAVSLVLPAYYIWLNRLPAGSTIDVIGNFDHDAGQLTIEPATVTVDPKYFRVPLLASSDRQSFEFSGPSLQPMTFEASIDAAAGTVHFVLLDSPGVHYDGRIEKGEARLDGRVRLTPASIAAAPRPLTDRFARSAQLSTEER